MKVNVIIASNGMVPSYEFLAKFCDKSLKTLVKGDAEITILGIAPGNTITTAALVRQYAARSGYKFISCSSSNDMVKQGDAAVIFKLADSTMSLVSKCDAADIKKKVKVFKPAPVES